MRVGVRAGVRARVRARVMITPEAAVERPLFTGGLDITLTVPLRQTGVSIRVSVRLRLRDMICGTDDCVVTVAVFFLEESMSTIATVWN